MSVAKRQIITIIPNIYTILYTNLLFSWRGVQILPNQSPEDKWSKLWLLDELQKSFKCDHMLQSLLY